MELKPRGKNGIYHCRFTAPGGRRVSESCRTSDYRQAKEYAVKLQAAVWRQQKLGEKPRRTWPEAAGRFLKETKAKRTHHQDLAKLATMHPHLGHLYLDQVDRDALDRIRDHFLDKGRSPGTVNRHFALVRTILRRAWLDWSWVDHPPRIRLLREDSRRFNWLTREQAADLLQALEERGLHHTADMARFALSTGMRESNLAGLEWSQVDLQRRVAWIHPEDSKSKKPISVPLNDGAVAVLRRQLGKHLVRVFTYRGKPVGNPNTRAWRQVLDQLGHRPRSGRDPLNFCWHDLRHTWASWHVQDGTPLAVLQELGGWADLSMVQRYAHLAPSHAAAFAGNSTLERSPDPAAIGANLAQVPQGVKG